MIVAAVVLYNRHTRGTPQLSHLGLGLRQLVRRFVYLGYRLKEVHRRKPDIRRGLLEYDMKMTDVVTVDALLSVFLKRVAWTGNTDAQKICESVMKVIADVLSDVQVKGALEI